MFKKNRECLFNATFTLPSPSSMLKLPNNMQPGKARPNARGAID